MNQAVLQARLQHLGGRYRWLRMPFELSPALEEFQRRIDVAHEGLPGQKAIADDILAFGSGDTDEEAFEDHDGNLPFTTNCYTNFFELDVLVSRTSKEVIAKRKPHFARYGLPDSLITDNVP